MTLILQWLSGFIVGFIIRGVLDRSGVKHILSEKNGTVGPANAILSDTEMELDRVRAVAEAFQTALRGVLESHSATGMKQIASAALAKE